MTIDTDTLTVLDFALRFNAAGISTGPAKRDGSKTPARQWKPYQERLPTPEELHQWHGGLQPFGIFTICGKVSGNREIIDFDKEADVLFPHWRALVEAEVPGLFSRLSIVETPRNPPGYHVVYHCPDVKIPGNTKLAMAVANDKIECLIETRGEGGYAVTVGSPGVCHPSGNPYRTAAGHPEPWEAPTITASERNVLIRAAVSFDRQPQSQPTNGIHHHADGISPNCAPYLEERASRYITSCS